MFRKIAFGVIGAAALGAAALAPSAASAGGGKVWHGGWHGHAFGHHSFYGGPTFYVGGIDESCYQKRIVETRRGPRIRLVNVCVY